MTSRLNLLVHPTDGMSFDDRMLNPLTEKFFNIVKYEPGVNYNKNDTVVVAKSYQLHNEQVPRIGKKGKLWYDHLRKQGFKLVVDNLWEDENFVHVHFPKKHLKDSLILNNDNWFWYNEAYLNMRLDQNSNYSTDTRYNKYKGGHITTKHLALMAIRRAKPFRTQLVDELRKQNLLESLLWSYLEVYNNPLPGDAFPSHHNPQRWLNPKWYNDTYFSLVVETLFENPGLHTTEKTFKPIAYYHPFVIAGQVGTLAHIKSLGFETYENLFDESYDKELNHTKRMSMVIDNVKSFDRVPYDPLTIEKLHYNRNHFYNTALIQQRFKNEIVNPILEYAAS